jgi:hypothetical protein
MIEAHDKLSRVPGLGESYPIRVLKDSIPVHSQAVWSYQALHGSSAKSTQVRSEIETLRDLFSTLLLLLPLLLDARATVQAINLNPLILLSASLKALASRSFRLCAKRINMVAFCTASRVRCVSNTAATT